MNEFRIQHDLLANLLARASERFDLLAHFNITPQIPVLDSGSQNSEKKILVTV